MWCLKGVCFAGPLPLAFIKDWWKASLCRISYPYCHKNADPNQSHCHPSKRICHKLFQVQLCFCALPYASSRVVCTHVQGLHQAPKLALFCLLSTEEDSQNKLITRNTPSGWSCHGCGRSADSTCGTRTDWLPRRGWLPWHAKLWSFLPWAQHTLKPFRWKPCLLRALVGHLAQSTGECNVAFYLEPFHFA